MSFLFDELQLLEMRFGKLWREKKMCFLLCKTVLAKWCSREHRHPDESPSMMSTISEPSTPEPSPPESSMLVPKA